MYPISPQLWGNPPDERWWSVPPGGPEEEGRPRAQRLSPMTRRGPVVELGGRGIKGGTLGMSVVVE